MPFRYEDRSNVKTIAQLAPGEMATVIAEVRSASVSGFRRRNLGLFEASFTDARAPSWWASGFMAAIWPTCWRRAAVALSAKWNSTATPGELTMLHPEFEILSDEDEDGDAALHLGRVVPIYEAHRQGQHACAAHAACIACWRRWRRWKILCRRISARAAETAGPLDGHPRDAFPAAGYGPAPAERVSFARRNSG